MIAGRFLLWARTADAASRADAAATLARAYLGSVMSPEERREAGTTLIALIDDPSPLVRRALAEEMATAADAPRPLILGLIEEAGDIAALLLAQSPVLTEADLVDAAAVGDGLAQRAVAQRPHLPVSVAAALAEVGGTEALLVLLANPTAAIPDFSLARILERERDCGAVREALLARADLPVHLRQAIAGEISQTLASFVSGCGWLSGERSTRLAREATERVAIALAAGGEAADAPAIVECLRAEGRLTAALILRSLLSGEPALAEAALTALSGLGPARAAVLLRDRRGAGFRALYRKAGLPVPLEPGFCAAAAAARDLGSFDGAPATAGRSRAIIAAVMTACERVEAPETVALMALLRRLDAEAAREEARGMAQALADDAAFALLAEMEPALLVEIDPADRRQAA